MYQLALHSHVWVLSLSILYEFLRWFFMIGTGSIIVYWGNSDAFFCSENRSSPCFSFIGPLW